MPITEQQVQEMIDATLDEARKLSESENTYSRENSLVITKLEEAQMWGIRDIQKKENS